MELFFLHLLKSCLVLTLFLVAYLLFLKQETFFNGNRLFLGLGVATAVLLPFFKITQISYVDRAPLNFLESTTALQSIAPKVAPNALEPWMLLALFYAIGAMLLTLRLFVQVVRIWRIKRESDIRRENSFYHVRTPLKISPFSFFRHIFYHPKQFAQTELDLIVAHEKVHARELHSLDILLMEILVILQWFNPFAWYYASMVKQNLEFVADHKTCSQQVDRKQYQYLMLNQVLTHQNLTIVNPFFNSLTQLSVLGKKIPLILPGGQIKKRIVMLHQKPSQKKSYFKALLVLPFLALFLLAFNTKKEVHYKDKAPAFIIEAPKFSAPILQSNLTRVSSTFGVVQKGIAKGKLHKGIDLVAKKGTPVMASAYGKVVESSYNNTNGNYVIIDHGNGYLSKYLHLDKNAVALNAVVTTGTTIGYVGNTGVSSGPHLHFEIVMNGKSVDPESFIAFSKKATTSKKSKTTKNTPKPIKVKAVPVKDKRSIANIELVITKKTTDAELEKMKADLAKDAIDFSYTVVHNATNEIKEISFQLSGKSTNGGTFNNAYNSSMQNGVIKPIVIYIDLEENLVSVGSKNLSNFHKSNSTVWIQDGDEVHEEIIIKSENGVKKIFIDGEEVDEATYTGQQFKFHVNDDEANEKDEVDEKDELNEIKLTLGKKNKKSSSEVFIVKDADSDSEVEIRNNQASSISFGTAGGKKPIFYIDGKKVSEKEMSALSTDKIAVINVYKGKKAIKKYGRKAKNGVVEVTTK